MVAFHGVAEVVFNEEILVEILYLNERLVLHVVDEQINFQWHTFSIRYHKTNLGINIGVLGFYLYRISEQVVVYQGSARCDQFIFFEYLCNVNVCKTKIEAYYFLEAG